MHKKAHKFSPAAVVHLRNYIQIFTSLISFMTMLPHTARALLELDVGEKYQ